MAALPCKNPACKSRGQPHPNCKCYPNMMAEGGEVKATCSGPHMPDCQHYLEEAPNDEDDVTSVMAHLGAHGLINHNNIDKHLRSIRRGSAMIKAAISGVLNGETSKTPDDMETRRKKVDYYLESGGITQDVKEALYQQQAPENFAGGGLVSKERKPGPTLLDDASIGTHYPVQNITLNATKARVSNYLNSLRPSAHSLKLPFDDDEDTTDKKRKYHHAIDIANHPLGLLNGITDGTIEPEEISHLKALYPELATRLQKGLTEKITEAQLEKKKPAYKLRQGLSLFMGTPLSSELTPNLIQVAQLTFAGKSQQQAHHQQPQAGKKNALSKSDEAFLTGDQAVTRRSQAQR